MAEVLAVVPVLDRPRNVRPLLNSFAAAIADTPARLVFVASPDDEREIDALEAAGADYLVAPFDRGPGDWARKTNLAYRSSSEPWLFTGADDLEFLPGWADRALECAAATRAAVVGTNDLGNIRVIRGDHATHNLVARWYADERGTLDGPGSVVSEVYSHNYVDDELVWTAKQRGLWAFCSSAEVRHLHPNWDRRVRRDATYELGERDFRADALLFRRRQMQYRPLRPARR